MSADVVIDLNADLGEGVGPGGRALDDALLGVVTSANVACGFHAGDAATMRRVCETAVARGVAIGAQVSYRDREGFGRRPMDVPFGELAEIVAHQIAQLDALARAAGGRVSYVKPHGALYNRVVSDRAQADAVVAGATDAGEGALPLLCLPGSALHASAAVKGLPIVTEAFADRAYTPRGTLVARGEAGAVITDAAVVVARSVAIARGLPFDDISGAAITVVARSLCLHSDTPGAAELAVIVRAALERAEVRVSAFSSLPDAPRTSR